MTITSALQKGARVIHLKERDGFTMIEGLERFIIRGSVIELAVAVVIVDAFSPVVNNLVGKVINPTIGGLFEKPSFNNVDEFHIGDATVRPDTVLTALITFLLIAAAVHLALVFPMDKLSEHMAKRKGLNAEETEVSNEVRPLTETRDALAGDGCMNGGDAVGGSYTGSGYRQ